MEYNIMQDMEESVVFQKLRKRRKRENVDAWSKEEKPWRHLQREKQKRKYEHSLGVA